MISTLISVLIVIVIIGLIVWAVRLIPMPEPFPTIVLVVGIIFVLLYLLSLFGGVHLVNP